MITRKFQIVTGIPAGTVDTPFEQNLPVQKLHLLRFSSRHFCSIYESGAFTAPFQLLQKIRIYLFKTAVSRRKVPQSLIQFLSSVNLCRKFTCTITQFSFGRGIFQRHVNCFKDKKEYTFLYCSLQAENTCNFNCSVIT